MRMLTVVVVGAVIAGVPAMLVAQEKEKERDTRRERVRVERRMEPGDGHAEMFMFGGPEGLPPGAVRIMGNFRRQRLGVAVNLRATAADSIGASLDAVTPGSPAAKAGLRGGDIITKLNGESLTSGRTRRDAEEDESVPGLRLVERAARLKPGDTVSVEYRRGSETRTATAVLERGGDRDVDIVMRDGAWRDDEGARVFTFGGPGGPSPEALRNRIRREIRGRVMPGGPGAFMFEMEGPLADLELVSLNSDLGKYFGATEGVLVVSAPADSPLGLKGGDVVVSVDGRKPTGPSHFMRILRTYDKGENVKLEILRDRRKQTVTGKLAALGGGMRGDGDGLGE
ncbi:MAG: PDZ domain-containing protein [Gemmatimonadales bacterium]|nr:PDZ domain-containing protein [Gemmatimonadales bacterium]